PESPSGLPIVVVPEPNGTHSDFLPSGTRYSGVQVPDPASASKNFIGGESAGPTQRRIDNSGKPGTGLHGTPDPEWR
ncbi:MAG: hypothetical protein OXG36_00775, partial [Caldilineaceae bacterium]|nr:hypothetical protein [Caldilineaceae bacterium]